MKTLRVLLPVVMLFSFKFSIGQQVQNTANFNTPVIKKGYYSIGNNSKKLYKAVSLKFDTTASNQVKKGYYSIDTDKENRKKTLSIESATLRPVVTKGYYSIGNNSVNTSDPVGSM